jgi:hypothetical protein
MWQQVIKKTLLLLQHSGAFSLRRHVFAFERIRLIIVEFDG